MRSDEADYLFTVISPCYNVEPWINDFFQALVRQTLDFQAHIQLIIVDDGSTDNTPGLAKKFADSYPVNVLYLRKENGGLSSARNHGLPYVKGEWVTFADPDDFVADDYFARVKNFIEASGFDGKVISCNIIPFHEKTKQLTDNHPLNFKFSEGDKIVDLVEQPQYIQLSVATAFIKNELFRDSGFTFDGKVKPGFEDAHLLNRLLLYCGNYKIACLQSAVYFYRKRAMGDSLLTTAWMRAERYREQIFYGNLNLLQYAKQYCNAIPKFIQLIIIYELSWFMSKMLKGEIPYKFAATEFEECFSLIRLVFKYIETDAILFNKLPFISFQLRLAMLYAFKQAEFPQSPFFLTEISPEQDAACFAHYSLNEEKCELYCAGTAINPLAVKTVHKKFQGLPLFVEQYLWAPLENGQEYDLRVNSQPMEMLAGGGCFSQFGKDELLKSHYVDIGHLPEALRAQRNRALAPESAATYAGCWLFMDRVHKADDNAEHLYRWMVKNVEPRPPIYFVLDRKSADWERLEREGFKLIAYKSEQHVAALWNAEWLISSHADLAVRDPLGIRDAVGEPKYKFAFLQHGVIKDDLSAWLNTVRMDLFVVNTQTEYESIVGGQYKFTRQEVVLTGMPRHDELIRKAGTYPKGRNILFCPTWRGHLKSSEAFSGKPAKEEIERYLASDFFKGWEALLSCPALGELARAQNCRLIFLPHPELERFKDKFTATPEFTMIGYGEVKLLQDLLLSCSMLVTDYSSLAMDFALLGRPVFYYQFPESPDFFTGKIIRPGYFSYRENGFGPVADNASDLITALQESFKNAGQREDAYEKRAADFFTLKDGNNCLRVYKELTARSEFAAAILDKAAAERIKSVPGHEEII